MSERALDVVRYIKAIEDSGGYQIAPFVNHSQLIPTHDRMRAEILDHADETDAELLAGFDRAGIVAPPMQEIRQRIESYR